MSIKLEKVEAKVILPKDHNRVKSSWGVHNKLKEVESDLHKLIPDAGPCDAGNPKLERLRVACNHAYELFNNGGFNGTQCFTYFKLPGRLRYCVKHKAFQEDWDEIERLVEPKLTKIIIDAHFEQFDNLDDLLNLIRLAK